MKLKRKMLFKMFKHHIAICVLLFMEEAYKLFMHRTLSNLFVCLFVSMIDFSSPYHHFNFLSHQHSVKAPLKIKNIVYWIQSPLRLRLVIFTLPHKWCIRCVNVHSKKEKWCIDQCWFILIFAPSWSSSSLSLIN